MNHRMITMLLLVSAVACMVVAFLLPSRIGHPVTPFMALSAEGAMGRAVTAFDGKSNQPIVVVFVLPGCPCSEEYETYVNRLYHAFGEHVRVMEVIAGDEQAAAAWKRQYLTPYPAIADENRKISHEFSALRSAYTALIIDGKISRLWPGYSTDMLRELGGRLAIATGVTGPSFDVEGAPERLTSGCNLEL